MLKNNYFYDNIITIVSPEGEKIDVERKGGEANHTEVFLRAEQKKPGLLDNYQLDPNQSGGFEFASFVAACNNVVFWPTNVNDNKMIIVSIPKMPNAKEREIALKLMEELKDNEVYVSICSFKKRKSQKIISETLSANGKYETAYNKLAEYFDKVGMLESMLDESSSLAEEVDMSKFESK